jgi:diguanylate cyclase (GGDEF)-like protein
MIRTGRRGRVNSAADASLRLGDIELVEANTELELVAYARLSGFFAQLLAGETPEALAATISGAVQGLVPCTGVVVQQISEANGGLVPIASSGDTRGAETMTLPLVALGKVAGSLSVFRNAPPFTDAEVRFVGRFADAASLVLDSARTRARLSQLAQTDDLTGMLNRRGFFEAAERELARAARDGGDTALLVVDVDDLKRVNDRYGHSVGDELLAGVARTLASRTRRGDIIGRLGGDEFAIVLPGAGIESAENLSEELEHLLATSAVEGPSGPVVASASVGVAATDGTRAGVVRLLARADVDMYRKKRRRKAEPEE